MSDPQPIRFSVPEAEFDRSLLPEAARERGSQAFRDAVTLYFKDAYREAGGRVDVAFATGAIEVNWEPQSGQVPASATITAHLEAGRYDDAIPLLRTRLQLEPDHVESLYNLGMVCSDRNELTEARKLLTWTPKTEPVLMRASLPARMARRSPMKRKRHNPEQIIRKLRTAEQLLNQGQSVADVCRALEVSAPTYHRWQQLYGGMKATEAKRLKELEQENTRLKRLLADAELDKAMLKELAEGNF
jgi:transposase-like protein